MKLSIIAEKTGAAIESGSPDMEITAAAGLDIAGEGTISFLANPKYTPQLQTTKAAAVFLNENVKLDRNDIAVLRAKDPYLAYTKTLRLFHPADAAVPGVHPTAFIDPSAEVSPDAEISANVFIGKNCRVGKGSKLHPNVTVYDGAE